MFQNQFLCLNQHDRVIIIMCGRFINISKINKVQKLFDIKNTNKNDNDIISYNIAPSQKVNIILINKEISIESSIWGLSYFDKKNNQKRQIINSRLETVHEKIIFKESFFKKRCLVPVNGYYEWKIINGDKIPYFIHLSSLQTMFFAGIWKFFDKKKFLYKTFSILTKNSNDIISDVHHRMPVIFDLNEGINYIMNDQFTLKYNFVSKMEDNLEYFPVSKFVNSPTNNSIKCITPISKF